MSTDTEIINGLLDKIDDMLSVDDVYDYISRNRALGCPVSPVTANLGTNAHNSDSGPEDSDRWCVIYDSNGDTPLLLHYSNQPITKAVSCKTEIDWDEIRDTIRRFIRRIIGRNGGGMD